MSDITEKLADELLTRVVGNKRTSYGVIGTLTAGVVAKLGFDVPVEVIDWMVLVVISCIGMLARD